MRNRRLLIPGGIHFITFRTEEGLPFVPLRFMNMLICSALARAQRLYPIKIICFVVQERTNTKSMGPLKLTSGSLLAERKPPPTGRKMICLSTNKELRQDFIGQFKRLRDICRATFRRWQQGETGIPFPPGMFPPHLPRMANFVPRGGRSIANLN